MKLPLPSSSLSWLSRAAVPVLLALASLPALAQAAPAPAVHQLWVAHGLWGFVFGLLGFLAGRNLALAGIVVVAALAYAALRIVGAEPPPEALQMHGARYPFHVQATALLVPLLAVAGAGARRTYFAHWSLRD
jgi:hypothetical protein